MKFRKFLRSKRLEDIRQVGVERVVIFTFGTGEFQNHLILELYSQGNIILTDSEFVII
jgi:predicted ribosome quality control (RQC) complex YloA/Tae2 family protein